MKTKTLLMLLTGLFTGFASLVFAGPGIQYWQTLNKEAQFNELKPGDEIAFVCNQCKTVTQKTVKSTAEATDFSREGAAVTCPACKKQVKVVLKRQRNDPPSRTEVSYVNENGEECFFIAKVPQ